MTIYVANSYGFNLYSIFTRTSRLNQYKRAINTFRVQVSHAERILDFTAWYWNSWKTKTSNTNECLTFYV